MGLQLGNPNALVYFGGMLPAYLDSERPLLTQSLIVMASVTATELAGLATYGASADALARRFASRAQYAFCGAGRIQLVTLGPSPLAWPAP